MKKKKGYLSWFNDSSFFNCCPDCGSPQINCQADYTCGFQWQATSSSSVVRVSRECGRQIKFISLEAVQSLENTNSWIRSQ